MFQAELGRMMREEQHKDYRRAAKPTQRTLADNQPQRNTARGWLVLPLVLATIVARLIMFSAHTIRH